MDSPAENPDRTQPVPSPEADDERTQTVEPRRPEISPEERDRLLAAELTRRGIPPDEIQRLVALGRESTAPPPKRSGRVIPTPPPIPPSEPFEPKPTITLPDFRESTPQERNDADKLLTAANIARRRGLFKEAEQRCREALDLIPSDAAALELYGDVLQGLGRVDDAVYAYGRAKEADPKRAMAEIKYAELTLAQNREIEMLRTEFIPRNPLVAIIFSALFPGAGQMYNGDSLKGICVVIGFFACVILLGWTHFGFPGIRGTYVPITAYVLTAAAGLTYIYAVVDANLSAKRGKRPKSGWEV